MLKRSLLLTLLLALLMPWAANAQEPIPYNEGFETMSTADDLTAAGWISYQTHTGSFLAIDTSATNVHSGSQALNIDSWDAGSNSDYVIVGLPQVDAAINGLQITFSYKVTNKTVAVGYLTDANDASTFVQLGAYSSASSYTTVTKELNEAPATAARIAIKYTGYYRCYIDDIEVKALPTCVKPTLGQAQFISEEGASFQWTENGSATSWVLEYSTDQNFTNATSVNRSGIPNYAITGLNAGTLYYVHVKSDCGGGDESDWSNVVTFTTLCEPINAEGYSENFDSYTGTSSGSTINLPDCWNRINTTSYSYYSGYPNINTSNASSSPNCLRFYSYYSSYSNYDPQPQYAILPPMNGLAGMQVTLKARGYNATSTFKIGTMSDPSDASSFTMIEEQTGLTTSYQEFEYVVPANCHDNCLAIMIEAATTFTAIGVYIDDIVIAAAPTCIKPTGLEVTATTTNTATLSWTNGAEGQTAWQICLNDDETNLIDANSNPFTIDETGVLSPASTYTAKVRANCGNGDYSDWSNTVTFDTPCDVITVTDSWSENFNSLTAGIPNCWDNSEGTTTAASYRWNYYATGHEGAGLRFNSYNNTDGYTNFLKTPTLNFATGKVMQLSFWYKNPTGGDFSVYISTDGGNTYTTELATGLTGASSWTQQEINLTNYVDAQNVVIVFKGTSNYGNGDAYIYLDDVAIAEAPSCPRPTDLAVTANSITSDGATITWTAGGSETEWQIEFAKDANFTAPYYETVQDNPTYTFHGLDDGATYFVHVQAVCGGSNGSSEYSSTVSFITLQTPANLPYATDFESGNDWLFVNGNLTNVWAYGEATNNGGTHALYISNDGGTTNAYTNNSAAMVYATKMFNFEAGIYVFSYDWKANGESTYDYLRVALVPSSEQLTAGTNPPSVSSGSFYNNLPTGWIALDGGKKLNLNSDWQSYTSNEIEITTAGTYMMVFAWGDDTSGGSQPPAAIDNVSIQVITCTTPTNLDVPQSSITATSAQLSWTETGDATAWEIELTDEDNNTLTIPVTATDLVEGVYTLTSLTPETIYIAKVRANCGDGYSNWSVDFIFETVKECQTPDGLTATVTTDEAVISWNGYGKEKFNLRYGTDDENWTTETEVGNPYTLTSLTPSTTYYVQVQPTCADADTWSASYSFTTDCDIITIAQDATYTYDFESATPWICWTNVAGSNVRSTGSNNTTGGNYKLQFKGTTTGNIVAMPTFTPDINGLMLTFWTRPEKYTYSYCGTFSVGYMTDLDDASTFVPVATYSYNDWTSDTYIEKKVAFASAPAGAYIAFCHNAGSTNYYWYVDDVTVEIAPSCTLSIEGYGDTNGKWYFIASPLNVDPATVPNLITPATNYDLFAFDESEANEWRNYKQHPFNLEPGKGYLYAHKIGGDFTLVGTPYTGNGTVTLQKTDGAEFEGWNLVGNPFTDKAYIDRPFYVMNPDGTGVLAESQTGAIQPMTGIFVTTTTDGEEMTFTTTAPGGKSSLSINVSNNRGNVIDRAIVGFDEGSRLPKFQLDENSTKVFFEQEGNNYAVVYGEAEGSMPLFFKAEENSRYTLDFKAENVDFAYLHLIDNETGEDIDLIQSPSYNFAALTTDDIARFKIVYAKTTTGVSEHFAFISDGQIILIGAESGATIQVIDALGRVVASNNADRAISTEGLSAGVYMIRLINGNIIRTQKIVVE